MCYGGVASNGERLHCISRSFPDEGIRARRSADQPASPGRPAEAGGRRGPRSSSRCAPRASTASMSSRPAAPFTGMMEHDLPTVVGRDFAGVVEAVGPGVDEFAAGDEVLGFIPSTPPLKSGSFAEYVVGAAGTWCWPASQPDLDFEVAAALPLAGSAALDLLEAIDGQPGDARPGGRRHRRRRDRAPSSSPRSSGLTGHRDRAARMRTPSCASWARPRRSTIRPAASPMPSEPATRMGSRRSIDLVDQQEALTELAAVVRSGGHVGTSLGRGGPRSDSRPEGSPATT